MDIMMQYQDYAKGNSISLDNTNTGPVDVQNTYLYPCGNVYDMKDDNAILYKDFKLDHDVKRLYLDRV